jgi:type IV pilus assembly protein PilO
MVYGFVNFVHTPRSDRTAQLAADIEKERELLAKGKRIAANFRTVQDDYSRLMQSWEVAQELLPTEKEMEGLLKSIAVAGEDYGIEFLMFRPLDPIEQPFYFENPIQIKTRSNMHDLGEFISSVAALERIVNVSKIKLTAYRPAKGRSPDTVDADFIATIYIFKSLGSPITVASEDEKDAKGKGKAKKKSADDKEGA